jgi:hypothetical protein
MKLKLTIATAILGALIIGTVAYAQMGGGISTPSLFKLSGNSILPIKAVYEIGSSAQRIAKIWANEADITTASIAGVATDQLIVGGSATTTIYGNGTTSTFGSSIETTGSISAVTGTFSGLTSSSIPYIGIGGLLTENNSTMYTDGTSAYFTSLYSGIFSLPQNGGLVSFIDIPVTTGASAGTEEGMTFTVDGLSSLSILRESLGTGTVANTTTLRVGNFLCLDIGEDINGFPTWAYFDNAVLIISTTTPCN